MAFLLQVWQQISNGSRDPYFCFCFSCLCSLRGIVRLRAGAGPGALSFWGCIARLEAKGEPEKDRKSWTTGGGGEVWISELRFPTASTTGAAEGQERWQEGRNDYTLRAVALRSHVIKNPKAQASEEPVSWFHAGLDNKPGCGDQCRQSLEGPLHMLCMVQATRDLPLILGRGHASIMTEIKLPYRGSRELRTNLIQFREMKEVWCFLHPNHIYIAAPTRCEVLCPTLETEMDKILLPWQDSDPGGATVQSPQWRGVTGAGDPGGGAASMWGQGRLPRIAHLCSES